MFLNPAEIYLCNIKDKRRQENGKFFVDEASQLQLFKTIEYIVNLAFLSSLNYLVRVSLSSSFFLFFDQVRAGTQIIVLCTSAFGMEGECDLSSLLTSSCGFIDYLYDRHDNKSRLQSMQRSDHTSHSYFCFAPVPPNLSIPLKRIPI